MKANDHVARRPARARKGLGIHDVLYVLFKHKWRILSLWLAGFVGAGGLLYHAVTHPSYEVCAKLLVRYVLERSAVDPYEEKVDAGGTTGLAVMDAEIEIIKSADLALAVVDRIGAARLLPEGVAGQPATQATAAVRLMKDLDVTAARGSNVISIRYRHGDPGLAVEVLDQLIDCYFARHLEIHRSTGAFENVARETDQARSRLVQTEEELRKLAKESGVLSYNGTKQALEERRNQVSAQLVDARVEHAQQRVRVEALERAAGGPVRSEAVAGPAGDRPAQTLQGVERVRVEARFADLSGRLAVFKQRRNELMLSRKPGDRMVAALDRQIDELEQRISDLQDQHPGLWLPSALPQAAVAGGGGVDLGQERAQLAALDAKVRALEEEARGITGEVDRLSAIGVELTKLERRKQLEEEKYRYFETSLEKARVDEALDPRSMPNIGVVQQPSTPVRSIPDMTLRLALGLAGFGMMGGLAWAFVTEWVIDRRVSRPLEIQARLQLPLMLTIPRLRMRHGGFLKAGGGWGRGGDLDGGDEGVEDGGRLVPYEGEESWQAIAPYAAAIRDRILFNFALNNITHKPKLVALTGLSPGAGASTLAEGVARSFAEGGGLKVLLVDLNPPGGRGARDSAAGMLPLKVALESSRGDAFKADGKSLYVASAPTRVNGRGAALLASSALHEMIPQLEASDFDYIIFDMPPMGPTSPTLAMAGFMDKVLLVLDAENTNRESLSWSYAELEKGRADVSCIFNKAKSHAPRWVAGEL